MFSPIESAPPSLAPRCYSNGGWDGAEETPPTGATGGQPATVHWTVRNDGAADPNSSLWLDNVYISPTPTLGGDSVQIGYLPHSGQLAPGDSYNTVRGDEATRKFVNDKEADQYLTRNYRKPYVVPDKV